MSNACDESKCVSKGLSEIVNDTFTCYGDNGAFYPMMCADGFLPKVVEDEPPYIEKGVDGAQDTFLRYFTCCPPDRILPQPLDATRHCNDPVTLPEVDLYETFATICDDDVNRKYPRRMKSSTLWSNAEAVVCCDSELLEDGYDDEYNDQFEYDNEYDVNATIASTNYLADTECVPYRDEFYKAARIQNKFGMIVVVSCDFSEGDFAFPRSINEGPNMDVTSIGLYQCCKHGPALPPFVEDRSFRFSVYPTILLCSIALCCSAVVFVGVLLPLLIQLQNGSYRQLQRQIARRKFLPSRMIRTTMISSKQFFRKSFISGSGSQHKIGSISTSHNPRSSHTKSTTTFNGSRISTIKATAFARFKTPEGASLRDITRDASEKSAQSMPSMVSEDSDTRSKSSSHGRLELQMTNMSNEGEPVWIVATQQPSTIKAEPQFYSSYNLYLVHLTFPDILYMAFELVLYFNIANQRFNPNTYSYIVYPTEDTHVGRSFEWPFVITYINANLYMNAIMAHALLDFLRACKRARRIKQPSLTMVNMQAGLVYLSSLLLLALNICVRKASRKAAEIGDFEKSAILSVIVPICNKIAFVIPIGYIIYVVTLIWWKDLMPSLDAIDPNGRAMRELALYFFRIIAVVAIWVPNIVICTFSITTETSWGLSLAIQLGSVQAIISAIAILTKRDVRKYVMDLITLSYLTSACNNKRDERGKVKTPPIAKQGDGKIQQDSPKSFWFEDSDNEFCEEGQIEFEQSSCQGNTDAGAEPLTIGEIYSIVDLEHVCQPLNPHCDSKLVEEVGSIIQHVDGTADFAVDSDINDCDVVAPATNGNAHGGDGDDLY